MSIKIQLAAAVAASALLTAGTALAQDYMPLAESLHAQGYENQARIRVRDGKLHVEASGSAGRTERVYTADTFALLEEESETTDGMKVEREFSRDGSLVKEEIERNDDDDDDDRDDDDHIGDDDDDADDDHIGDDDDHDDDDRNDDDRDDDDRDGDDRDGDDRDDDDRDDDKDDGDDDDDDK